MWRILQCFLIRQYGACLWGRQGGWGKVQRNWLSWSLVSLQGIFYELKPLFLDHRLESLPLLHQCAMQSHFKSSFVCNMWQILESRRSGEEWEYLLYYLDFTEESKYVACNLLAFLCICRFCSQGKVCEPYVFNWSKMQGGSYSRVGAESF